MRADVREVVLAALADIAPEVDPTELRADEELRAQVELDSMDVQNWFIAIAERTGVEIPESDYAELATLDQLVAYLERATGAP